MFQHQGEAKEPQWTRSAAAIINIKEGNLSVEMETSLSERNLQGKGIMPEL
eukprot:gene14698-20737_t